MRADEPRHIGGRGWSVYYDFSQPASAVGVSQKLSSDSLYFTTQIAKEILRWRILRPREVVLRTAAITREAIDAGQERRPRGLTVARRNSMNVLPRKLLRGKDRLARVTNQSPTRPEAFFPRLEARFLAFRIRSKNIRSNQPHARG